MTQMSSLMEPGMVWHRPASPQPRALPAVLLEALIAHLWSQVVAYRRGIACANDLYRRVYHRLEHRLLPLSPRALQGRGSVGQSSRRSSSRRLGPG
jgi:hypothetical protein